MNGRSSTANETPEARQQVGRHRRPGAARRMAAWTAHGPRHGRRAGRRADAVRTLGGGLALVALAVLTGLPHGASAATAATAAPVPAAVITTDAAGATTTTTTATTATTASAGRAEKKVCDKFGSTAVQGGRYEVQNDLWGASTPQCIYAFDTGFRVEAKHNKTSGPASYPSMVFGCNYGNCTKGTPFPRPIADLGDLRTSWSTKTPATGDYNVSYDIWLDPTARKDGRPTGLELMVWLKHTDRVQPIGKKVGTATVDGVGYDVWLGKADLPTISYVRQQPTNEVKDMSITDFVTDAQKRGQAKEGWYLTSVQAGFEPWIGGDGLETTSFSVTRNGQ
ncbi:GH12 family glycosyl hydrolase domain-containing protein [Actinomycetospora chiangmaiensis]|uniref:GH12 family glycosyl hydrolase domain-containing protein n=1 Tax=Actinomycetospora chiangmaiensis TaxID=402650 RepID=UPI00035C57FA|nr:hypothetical protein [Actinomycetospora chiangmaiensis]